MCHCAMAHGPLLGHHMGPWQLLFNFRICKHSKMFKTDYQAVRNENNPGWEWFGIFERLNNSSCSLQNTIKSSPKTFRTAKNFRVPLSARMARPLNWDQSESAQNMCSFHRKCPRTLALPASKNVDIYRLINLLLILFISIVNLQQYFRDDLRLHYMIGAFDTKNIHYSVSFYWTSLKIGRNIAW